MRSLRLRLVAVMAAVVATAMGVVFLYVVPTLRDNLIDARFDRLEAVARTEKTKDQVLLSAIRAGQFGGRTQRRLNRISRLANARVGVFKLEGDRPVETNASQLLPVRPGDPVVRTALRKGDLVRARDGSDLVVAFPVNGGVVVLAQQLGDINDVADVVERQILLATVLALFVASLVGWGAAHAVTHRLSRLERAADRISTGEFNVPIGDDSPDELGRLSRSFDLMQTRLGQADRARKEFIANASHELRTPLFSLAGFLELLDDEDIDPDTRAGFLREMRDQVSRLTKLATDLLDLSRLDAGAVDVAAEPVDLAVTARGLVREFRALAAGRGSRITLVRAPDPVPNAVADEQRVQQIGRALLDNAIRHTPNGTEVRVAVVAENGVVRLDVSDNGPGIDDETAVHLFERFYRGEATTAPGSGLGLAIARQLAERMDGRLELSPEGEWTRFSLTLPVEQEAPG
jgi:two-component system, OmpR family, sensor kinase